MDTDIIKNILKTEFCEEFIDLMRNRMVMGFYTYGPMKTNYKGKLINCIESMKLRIKKFEETGNIEYLVDVANFAMIEFKYPQHERAHFRATDNHDSPGIVGMSIQEIKDFDKGIDRNS